MKNTMFESKNTLNRITSRSDIAEEKISKPENTAIETTQNETRTGGIKKNKTCPMHQ